MNIATIYKKRNHKFFKKSLNLSPRFNYRRLGGWNGLFPIDPFQESFSKIFYQKSTCKFPSKFPSNRFVSVSFCFHFFSFFLVCLISRNHWRFFRNLSLKISLFRIPYFSPAPSSFDTCFESFTSWEATRQPFEHLPSTRLLKRPQNMTILYVPNDKHLKHFLAKRNSEKSANSMELLKLPSRDFESFMTFLLVFFISFI